jgi:glycosyltransferase involved in cell wall biosynthesis
MAGSPSPPERPLRVALDGIPLVGPRTGVGVFCHELIRSLVVLPGLDVAVYAVTWRTRPEIRRELPTGGRLVGLPVPARAVNAAWRAGVDLPVELFVGRLDVVHGTNFVVPPARRAARVVTVHDLTPLHFPDMCEAETLAYPALVRRAVEGGAWVHTHSTHVRDEVIEAFDADPARVRAIAPGVPALRPPPAGAHPGAAASPASGAPARALPGAAAGFGRYVLAVGTVEPRKDYPGLVRAFDALAPGRPDLGLVIAGRDGWGAQELDEAVASSPHRSRIARVGYMDDAELAAALDNAAVLAYPSRYEGFGLPPLQAMQRGVPVVATAAGALPEVLGDAALMVQPGDHAALAEAIGRLLDDPSASAALAEKGRARAGYFTWEKCASAMAGLYLDAADRRAGDAQQA